MCECVGFPSEFNYFISLIVTWTRIYYADAGHFSNVRGHSERGRVCEMSGSWWMMLQLLNVTTI